MNKPLQPPLEDDPEWDDLAAELEALGPPPGFDDLADEESDARAEADIAAGRVVSHQRVMTWLEALLTDPDAPRPKPDACDG